MLDALDELSQYKRLIESQFAIDAYNADDGARRPIESDELNVGG